MSLWDILRVEREGPKYLTLVEGLAEAVEKGALRAGRRLPSQRLMAQRLGLSTGTVTRAYEEALRRGLIAGEIGRGTYIRHFQPRPLSVVDGSRIPSGCLDLYQNFPVALPELENLVWADALQALRRDHDLAALARASWSEVSPRSQAAGARWISRLGLDPAPRNIVECPGMPAVLAAVFAATTDPGDCILAPGLSHPSVRAIAEQLGISVRGLPLDADGVEPAAFEVACREHAPRAIYLAPTIHAPTATTMPDERRRAIALIAERHDVWIVEDESAAFLIDEPPLPVAAHAPRRGVLLADVWMALSLGLRTTYVLVPDELMRPMATAIAAMCGVTAPLLTEIAATWIECGVAERLIEARRTELAARNALTLEVLHRRVVRSHPCGHHVWVELPAPWHADVFVLRAEQRGVAVLGADWFFLGDLPRPEAIRICIGNAPDRAELRRALELLDGLMDDAVPVAPAGP